MGIRERSRQRHKRIEAHIAHSHEEAEEWDLEFWQRQTPQMRLAALVAIHEDIRKARPRSR